MKNRLLFGFWLIALLTACEEESLPSGAISVSATTTTLTIRNNSDSVLYFAIIPERIVPLIDWIPLSTEENRLEPSEQRVLPLDEEMETFGSIPSGENLVIYYWQATLNDGQLEAGPLSQLVYRP